MKLPIHNARMGARFPPLSQVTFSCLTCQRRKTLLAADAFIKWGMHVRIGVIADYLTRDCTRRDGKGNRICRVLAEGTHVLETSIPADKET